VSLSPTKPGETPEFAESNALNPFSPPLAPASRLALLPSSCPPPSFAARKEMKETSAALCIYFQLAAFPRLSCHPDGPSRKIERPSTTERLICKKTSNSRNSLSPFSLSLSLSSCSSFLAAALSLWSTSRVVDGDLRISLGDNFTLEDAAPRLRLRIARARRERRRG
jgi:hypothetical protein